MGVEASHNFSRIDEDEGQVDKSNWRTWHSVDSEGRFQNVIYVSCDSSRERLKFGVISIHNDAGRKSNSPQIRNASAICHSFAVAAEYGKFDLIDLAYKSAHLRLKSNL